MTKGITQTRPGNNVILFPSFPQDKQSHILFKDVALTWLFEEVKGTVTSRTLEWYYSTLSNHLFPAFGENEINDISLDDVLDLLSDMSSKVPRTAKLAMMLVKRIMVYAYDEQYLHRSWPIHKVKILKGFRRSEIKYIPQAQRSIVLKLAAEHELLYPILVTSMFVGLRPGELIALKWSKVNFQTGFIEILENSTYDVDVTPSGISNKRSVDSATKTAAGMRKNKAPKIVLQALITWRHHCIQYGIYDPDGYVFVSSKGEQRAYAGLTSLYRRFSSKNKVALRGLNIIPKMPRHTCATMLLENKVNPKIVQQILGHKNIETTLGTYSHVTDEVLEVVADKLNDIYCDIKSNSYSPKV